MKKIIVQSVLLFTVSLISCTEDTVLPLDTPIQEKGLNNRSIEEIIKIAENAPLHFDAKDETRGTNNGRKEISLSSITAITNKGLTRSADTIDTLLHVINYENNEGYVIVSAAKGTPGVIAYIDEGQYNLQDINDNRTDIGYVTEQAIAYLNNTERLHELKPGLLSDTITFRISPLLQTKWGQREPEGKYCPNGISGCTNTAMAQIFAYYEYPKSIQLTYEEADRDYQFFDWEDIKRHTIRHTTANSNGFVHCISGTESHNAIGRLCRQLGKLNDSSYGESATGTMRYMIKITAEALGYTCSNLTSYNDTCTIEPLKNFHPLIMGGNLLSGGGHIWIVDGYMDMRITTTDYLVGQVPITTRERFIYNHVNWGWDGKDNGYILSGIFDNSRMHSKDPSIHGSGNSCYNFNTNLQYIEIYRPNTSNPIIP